MNRTSVESSNIKSIGYDEATNTLEVEFVNGSVYQYSEVPRSVYEGLMKADSIGRYFNENIRRAGFAYTKV